MAKPRRPQEVYPPHYDIDITPKAGAVRDGDVRQIATVKVTRYDTPTGPGQKAGTTQVRAFGLPALYRLGEEAGRDLIRRDKAKVGAEIEGKIERLEQYERQRAERIAAFLRKPVSRE